ncbi:MFS transporter [Subtercola boreus]|uniref:MFS transporter n=1 Tax=Subtercola boreus TaxID=120213 RepID=A0A3E0VFX6_9MICO|nr:MFS transporter [Subtercola boreus]RFA08856.1 MFS transporter [Subtercola boreus]TQL54171.1 benzoate transport [Subtercola boreus]
MSIRESIDRAPLSRYQILVITICLVIVLIEGYDLLLMAFSASAVAAEWKLNATQIGVLLSSVGIGLVFGSALIAPLADRIGRRRMTLLCLGIVIVSMAGSALTTNMTELGITRVITGVGVGGLVAGLPVVISEFSPQRRRATMVALGTAGLPIGGVVGGFVAAIVLGTYGWRASFVVGAVFTLIVFVVVFFALPESIDFLLFKRPRNALETVNRTLVKMKLAAIDALPDHEPRPKNVVVTELFSGKNGRKTALIGFAFFVMMAAFYFANGWTPRLLQQAGMTAQQGIGAGVLLNVGGALAAIVFALLAIVFRNRTLTIIAFAGAAIAFLSMGLSFGSLGWTLFLALAVGALIQACATGLFTISPELFPTSVRTTGVGFAVMLGRIGAIISPILAGVLIDGGWSAPSLYLLFALPLVLGGLAVVALGRSGREARKSGLLAPVSAGA